MPPDGDPTDIRSLAVTVEDVVTALELNRTTARQAVLRVTPPFSGRMRARLHVLTGADDASNDAGGPLTVDPGALVGPDPPAYPTAADTEAQLRADPETTYTVERHHEHHRDAVAEWRHAVADHVRARVTIDTPAGPHTVAVTPLGDPPGDGPAIPDESRS